MKFKTMSLVLLSILMLFIIPGRIFASEPSVSYQVHVKNIGWQNSVRDGSLAGTTGRGLQIEALIISLVNSPLDGGVRYQSYVKSIGWQEEVTSASVSGTTGCDKRIEAVRISLTGSISDSYDIYYRVHVQNVGWMGWASNGKSAGTVGYNRRLEAVEIKLVKKGLVAPGSTMNNYMEKELTITYQTHVSNIGWQSMVSDGNISGTTGRGLQVEAYKLGFSNETVDGGISYQSFVKNIGWQSMVSDGNISGTTGQNKRIEAIKINLTGNIANTYDVYYRVHVQNVGWMGWTTNGSPSGTIGYDRRIEAIEIKLLKKGADAPGDFINSYQKNSVSLSYSSHVQSIGWQSYVKDGTTSGTTGQSKRVEAYKIKFNNETIDGGISYSSHVQNIGWQSFVSENSVSGTTGQSKRIEAIKIKLTGIVSEEYDIYYRVHIQNVGWMDWASNGDPAGTTGAGFRIEAIEIKLVKKGDQAPGSTATPFREAKWTSDATGNKYYYNIYGNLVTGAYNIGGTTNYFGPTGIYLGTNNLKILDVSAHQGIIDWNKVASSGIYGVILRVGYWNIADSKFATNISEVKRLGIPYGIYLFSYSLSGSDSSLEANFTNNMISKYGLNPTLGIYYDIESWYNSANDNSDTITKATYDLMVSTYINNVSNYIGNKYKVKVYANLNFANTRFNDYVRNQIDWIAQYNTTCSYTGNYSMWQYTSSANISGINGYVDMSIKYK